MSPRFHSLVAGVAATLAATVPHAAVAQASLRAAAAKADITPTALAALDPMGYGAFRSVHDPIFARVLLIESGGDPVAIVALDAIETGDTTALRERIHRETGIEVDHVFIAASHDHSAPRRGVPTPGALTKFATPQTDANTVRIDDAIVAASRRAKAALRPARIGFGEGRTDINASRDVYTPSGWKFGYNPDGPSDKKVRVLRVEGTDGRPIAILFNYAVHPTVTLDEHQLGGDLVGVAERMVEDEFGDSTVALFTQGAGGDQRARFSGEAAFATPGSGGFRTSAFDLARAQGTMLAAEVTRVARGTPADISKARVTAADRVIACPIRPGAQALRTFQTGGQPADQIRTVPIRLGVVTIGDLALAMVGGEVVTNIAERLYRASPLRSTMLVTLTNDRTGYFVDDATYDTNDFEVQASPAARGCAETGIVDGLVGMIKASR